MPDFQRFLAQLQKCLTSLRPPKRRGLQRPPRLEPLEARTLLAGEFTDQGGLGIVGTLRGDVAWGDYDNDGDLDAVVTGRNSSLVLTATVYNNDGSGAFTDINAGLAGVYNGTVVWGDYDQDTDLDLLVTGTDSGNNPITQIYRNDGSGTFTDINAGLLGLGASAAAWGDFDNDGDLDILSAGRDAYSVATTAVYRNDAGVFTEINAGLTGVTSSATAWADYDNDGDLDALISGRDGSSNDVTLLYQNAGNGTFSEISAGLTGFRSGAIAWGDYDSDGDLDLALKGYTSSGLQSKIYRNDGNGIFTDIVAGLVGVGVGDLAWGDYDNDGQLDLVLTGYVGGSAIALVYHNDSSDTFADINAGLSPADYSAAQWGDYDADGDLDLLVISNSAGYVAHVYRNDAATVNTPAAAPTALTETFAAPTSVTFSWTAATDTETSSAAGLSYNLRVGTTPGGSEVFATTAYATTGLRTVAAIGPIQGTSYTLTGLTPGQTYYWSVQAVDAGLMGGAFATEEEFTMPQFTDLGDRGIEGAINGSVAWGDYDNDGDLDVLVTGYNTSSYNERSIIYQNDGNGNFTDINAGLAGVSDGEGTWGDYDRDGDLDVLLVGVGNSATAKVYRNDGSGTFTDLHANLSGVYTGAAAWGDYDNDGDLDIVVTGLDTNTDLIAKIYRNAGNGNFVDINAGLTGLLGGSADWADYDNDGSLDLLITGVGFGGPAAILYHNDGSGTFTDVNANLPGVYHSETAWGDYDQDGDLDLAITGLTGLGGISRILRNDGSNTFTDIAAPLIDVIDGGLAWGDYDNDGDLDLLLSGYNPFYGPVTKVYENYICGCHTFPDSGSDLVDADYSAAAWGDVDGDGDLDFLVIGYDSNGFAKVYRNDSLVANTAPDAPTNLAVSGTSTTSRTLSWTPATDTETSAGGMSYNLRVGTTPGGSDVYSTMADSTSGVRTVAAIGPIQATSFTLNGLQAGVTYYWSVQAIDAGLTGGAFATEGSFHVYGPPVVTAQNFLIGENSVNGAFIGTLLATDPDAGQTKSWAITAGNTNNAFAINPTTGVLTVNNTTALNYEAITQFNLTVTATDNGTPALSGSAAVTVFLRNENDAPVVTAKQFLIGENSNNGAYIGTIPVTDQDAGQTHTYSIVAGNLGGAFAINPTTGVLSVNNNVVLDYEAIQRFDLTIRVVDNGNPAKSGSAIATVFLRDANDAPVLAGIQCLIGENSVNGAFIATIPVTDQDAGQTHTFSIVAGNTGNAFAINPTTGALTVNNSSVLNYETVQRFDLTIRVADNGNPAKSGSAVTTVFLRNENDAPVVTAKQFLIGENSVNNAFIGTIPVTDQDAGQTHTFSIIAGNIGNAFAINPTTGVLTVNNSAILDYENNQRFDLTIRVVDNGSPALSGAAVATVFLRDVNDAPVVAPTQFLISENSVNGAYIGVVPVYDQDAGQTHTYSIVAGNTGNAFAINPTTGVLSVNNTTVLNYETITQFNLVVRVVDNGSPAVSGSAAVTVFLRDVVGARPASILEQDTTTVVVPTVKKAASGSLARLIGKAT